VTTQPAAKPRLNSAFKQLMSLHWAMSACYLVVFITGAFMARLPRELFIRRGADNGFPDFADFNSAAGMVEKIYETPAKVYEGMVQNFCSARQFVRFHVASSGCWFLTF
jgi:hypothetical protein